MAADDDSDDDGPYAIPGTKVTRVSPGKPPRRRVRVRRLSLPAQPVAVNAGGVNAESSSSSWVVSSRGIELVRFLRSVSPQFGTRNMMSCFESAGLLDGQSLRAAAALPDDELYKMLRHDMALVEQDVVRVMKALRALS